MRKRWLALVCLAAGTCGVIAARCGAGDRQPVPAADGAVAVEFFAGIRSGQLQVALVPHGYSLVTMRVRNNTSGVLSVSLPKSFAAVPTARWQKQEMLRQQGHTPSLGDGYVLDPNGSQGLAGSLSGPWAAQSPPGADAAAGEPQAGGDGPRPWILAPGQMVQFQLPSFCLEFGKPDPHRRIPYQIVELQDLNDRPVVQELLDRFSAGTLDQRIVQLAVWHVANGVPWQMLANVKVPRPGGRGGGSVTPQELFAARQLAESLPSYGSLSGSLGGR